MSLVRGVPEDATRQGLIRSMIRLCREPVLLEKFQRGEVELQALAPVSAGIQALLRRETCGVEEVIRAVERDPAIAAQILRGASTSYYRGARRLETLRDACVHLGNKRVLAVAQEALLSPLFDLEDEPFATVARQMWRSVVVTAHGARRLTQLLEVGDAEEVLLAAMPHIPGQETAPPPGLLDDLRLSEAALDAAFADAGTWLEASSMAR